MRFAGSGVVLAAAGLLVAACTGPDASPDTGSTASSSTSSATPTSAPARSSSAGPSSPAGPSAPASPEPSIRTETTQPPLDLPTPTSNRIKGARTVTVTGTVQRGVELSCLLLDNYLLLGGPRDALRPGRTVTVTGRVVPDMVTTCQQGIPLVVARVTPAA
jgi:hypothetical protein